MAGPVPPYLATQTAAQTAFTVPFGLITFVNGKIAAATAAGEFNTTVDCSLFVTEDVSNLRVYLDSLGYHVDFAKDTNNKSLNIDWGKFLDDATDATTVFQGTTPWIIAGTVDQGEPGATPWPVSISSFPGNLTVDQGTSPWIVAGTVTSNQGTSPWVTSISNFPATQPVSGTVTALQGTSPWVVSGTITTSPDVNIHDSAGNALTSTVGSLNANITNFPATTAVTQSTSPWVVSGTVAATQSGTWTTGRTWALSSGTDSVTVLGTVTANQGTSPWVTSVSNFPATVAVTQSTSPWVISGTSAATQSGTWSITNISGTISLPTGASTAALQTQPGVDIGDVTVNNAAGAAAVNIQDGGNIITVDGTVTANQGTAATLANRWPVIVTDGTNTMPTADVAARAQFNKITDGTDTLGVNPDGSVVVQPVLEYYVGQGQVFTLTGSFNAATGGSDNPIFLIKNPNASGKTLRLRKIYVGCNVANVIVSYSIYYTPTITVNGTAATPRNNLIGSGTASIVQAFSLPTLSSLGTLIFDSTVSQNGTASEMNPAIDIPANQTIVVAANPASNNRAVQITTIWMEV